MSFRPFLPAPVAPWLHAAAIFMVGSAPWTMTHAQDRLKEMQAANIANAKEKAERPYHFGSQGAGNVFSNHTSHSNRLIPFYTFGKKVSIDAVTGANSRYRDSAKLQALYGFSPENTLNPDAEYADQSDLYQVQRDAVARGVKHLFIVWFDGMDWVTTQAAAVAKSGKVYTEGKGEGLNFQADPTGGTAKFGFYVTSPTHDKNTTNVDEQTVQIPPDSLTGGYDVRIAGPNPWTLGPLGPKAPGYFKGQGASNSDRKGVEDVGAILHAYTDSSTSAAEFASGVKAYNSGVNVGDDGRFIPTFFHQLQADGWKLGTATSVPFDHASPSAMYAHNVDRDDYQDLARDMLGLPGVCQQTHKDKIHPGLDVVLGTGFGQEMNAKSTLAQGKDAVSGNIYIADADKAAIDVKNGGKYVVAQTTPGVEGGKALIAAAESARANGKRLFGLYGSAKLGHLPYRTADGKFDPAPDGNGRAEVYTPAEVAEQPTLADMTKAALTVLTADPKKPFALFVESGDVDYALHSNNLDNAVGAVYSGEAAIQVIIDWVEKNSNWDESAMIVTADHGHYLVIDDLKAIAGAAR